MLRLTTLKRAHTHARTHLHIQDVCAHCLKSLVGPAMALPPPDRDNSDYALPLVERKTCVSPPQS